MWKKKKKGNLQISYGNFEYMLWCQMKNISSKIWLSSRSSGVLCTPIFLQVDFGGLRREVLWLQSPASLEGRSWGCGADFGLRDLTKSRREVSYRELLGWNDDEDVVTSSFWLPVGIGDVDASFLTPAIVPLWSLDASFFWHVQRASSSTCDWNPTVFSLLFSPLLAESGCFLTDGDAWVASHCTLTLINLVQSHSQSYPDWALGV